MNRAIVAAVRTVGWSTESRNDLPVANAKSRELEVSTTGVGASARAQAVRHASCASRAMSSFSEPSIAETTDRGLVRGASEQGRYDEEDDTQHSVRRRVSEQVFALGRVRGGIVEVSSEEETEGDTQASKRPNEKNRACAKVAAGRRTESSDRGSSTVSRRERQGLAQKKGAMRSAEESTNEKSTMSVSNLSRLNEKQVTSRQTVQHAHISRTIGPNVQVPMNAMGTMESGNVGGIQEEFAHEEMCWDLSELIQDIEVMRILNEVRDTGAREGEYLLVSGDSTAQ